MSSECVLEMMSLQLQYQSSQQKNFNINEDEFYNLEIKLTNDSANGYHDHILDNFISDSKLKIFNKAAAVTDNHYSTIVAKQILLQNGSAVDSAIAAAITNSVIHSHHHGLGGGNLMILYLRDKKKVITIDAREAAPIRATRDMFTDKQGLSYKSGLSSGIPGEIAGFWLAHKIGGRLPWKKLFQPAINLCRKGVVITKILSNALAEEEHEIRNDPELSKIYINPLTNTIYKENDKIKMPNLANTLEIISEKGAEAFYDGELSNYIIQENNDNGGIWTIDDLKNYKAIERPPIEVQLNDKYRACAIPPPSCGILVLFILSVMKNFNLNKNTLNTNESSALFYHRVLETFKHAYAKRTYLGDINFCDMAELMKQLIDPESLKKIVEKIDDYQTFDFSYYNPGSTIKNGHGTSHISILAPNGDAVSVTSSVNTFFGAKYCGAKTGIIYNGHMDDFSLPETVNFFYLLPCEANFIKPGKRPISSMSPLIVLDEKDDARLVIGSSGGTRIVTAVALVTLRNIFLDINIKAAIDQSRFHHQLFPTNCEIEYCTEDIKELIRKKGHEIKKYDYDETFVNAIERRENGELWAVSDGRIGGLADGF